VATSLAPILAYGAVAAQLDPSDENRDQVVAWWRTAAEHFAEAPAELAFNLVTEVSDALGDDPARLNDWYARVLAAVRDTNPTRVIFIAPRKRSDPFLLPELDLPEQREFLAAEWHFYASGPTKDPGNTTKRWTTGTAAERKLVTDKVDAALAWGRATGVPTWVGAWMTNDFNRDDSYTIDEQLVFCSFVACSLEKAGIPSALNADHHYYDAQAGAWIEPAVTVLDVFIDPAHPLRVACDR
jgi:hypothetical protein